MKDKNLEPDAIFCICGHKAKGIKCTDFYLVICDKCKKEYKFDSKKLCQETVYTMFIDPTPDRIKVIAICGNCKQSLYHNYKYQFCTKCRVIKINYK